MIEILVSKALATVTANETITSGMVGTKVHFSFSDDWDGLEKTAVFKTEETAKMLLESKWDDNTCVIPWEVLATPGLTLRIGVYGYHGETQLPTIWADVGLIREGTDPSADISLDPTPPVWQQIQGGGGGGGNCDCDGLKGRVEDLEGNYSELKQTATEISSRVEDVEGNYSEIKQTAKEISTRVEDVEGDFSAIKQRADSIETRVQNAEGNYSSLKQTVDGFDTKVADVNGKYTEINQKLDEITASASGGDGNYASLSLKVDGLESEVKKKVDQATYDSYIKETADTISTKVSKTDLDSAVQTAVDSSIEQKADSIKTEVKDELSGEYSSLTQTVNGFNSRVGTLETNSADYDKRITQNESDISSNSDDIFALTSGYSSLHQDINTISAEVSGKVDSSDVSSIVSSKVSTELGKISLSVSSNSKTSTFQLLKDGVVLDTDTCDMHVKSVNIDGTVTADEVRSNTVKIGSSTADYLNITSTTVEDGTPGALIQVGNYGTAMRILADTNLLLGGKYATFLLGGTNARNYSSWYYSGGSSTSQIKLSSGNVEIKAPDNVFTSNGSTTNMRGSTSCKLYAGSSIDSTNFRVNVLSDQINFRVTSVTQNGTALTSDRSKKNSIDYDLSKYKQFLLDLKPCRYKYNDGESGRYHIGAIAQDVKKALDDNGISTQDFAGYVKYHDTDDEGNVTGDTYGLRYEEFTMLNTMMVQELVKRVDELEAEVKKLKGEA